MTRQEQYDAAQQALVDLLKNGRPHRRGEQEVARFEAMSAAVGHDVAMELESERMDAAFDLLSTRDDLVRLMDDAKRTLDQARPYLHGEAACWNSSGLLQSTGVSIDRLSAVFTERVGRVQRAELAIVRVTHPVGQSLEAEQVADLPV
jgi:hypothetical protein